MVAKGSRREALSLLARGRLFTTKSAQKHILFRARAGCNSPEPRRQFACGVPEFRGYRDKRSAGLNQLRTHLDVTSSRGEKANVHIRGGDPVLWAADRENGHRRRLVCDRH